MSIRWKKYPKLYVRFPLRKHSYKINEVTRGIADNNVSNFVIYKMFWLIRKQKRKIEHTFYFIFSTIHVSSFYRLILIYGG